MTAYEMPISDCSSDVGSSYLKVLRFERNDMAEAMEIVRSHLPRAVMRYVDPFRLRLGTRALVGRMSDMPVAGPGGVDLHLQPPSLRLAPAPAPGPRPPATVHQTDEETRNFQHKSFDTMMGDNRNSV